MRKLVMALGMMANTALGGFGGSLAQESYRWRNDDGSEIAATWKAGTNTAITGVARGQNIRLRFSVRETGGAVAGTVSGSLQYATATNGPWTALGTDDLTPFAMTATAQFATGDLTSAQLGSGPFVAGACVEGPATATPSTSISPTNFSNFEYCFRATAKAAGNTKYYFQISGLSGYSQRAELTIAAGEANEPPDIRSALAAGGSVVSNFSYTIAASGSEPISYGASGLPAGLTFSSNTISGTPSASGVFSIGISAVNAWGNDSNILALTVLGNMPPVASNQAVSTVEASDSSFNLVWSDADQPQLTAHTFTILTGPSHGTLQSNYQRNNNTNGPSTYYYKAASNYTGPDVITWKCSDGKANSNTGTVSITIGANTPPVAQDGNSMMSYDDLVAGCNLLSTDTNAGQVMKYTLVSAPAHGSIESVTAGVAVASAYWRYLPGSGFAGTDSFTWKCNDGADDSNIATYSVTVCNAGPVAFDQSEIAGTGRTSRIRVSCVETDSPLSVLHVTVLSGPSHGSLEQSGLIVYYTPVDGYLGSDSFTWRLDDSVATSQVATCSLTVAGAPPGGTNIVLLIVKDIMLPEISNEVARLKMDLEWEKRTVKIVPWSVNNAQVLWQYLTNEYRTVGQTLEGAILIGNMPFATSGCMSDFFYWDMSSWLSCYNRNIWVSRMYVGQGMGDEVTLLKQILQQNHEYRSGISRYGHNGFEYAVGPWETSYYLTTSEAASKTVFPGTQYVGNDVQSTFRRSCELLSGICHGPDDINGAMVRPLAGNPVQARFLSMCSCNSGFPGGPVHTMFLYRKGPVVALSSTQTISPGGYQAFENTAFLKSLQDDATWGRALELNQMDQNAGATLLYGDLSMRIKMSPSNRVPVITSALTQDKTAGNVPLTVNYTVRGSDPDGFVASYDWYATTGYSKGWGRVDHSGPTFSNLTHIYTEPHVYPNPHVEVVDEHGAIAWAECATVVVGPEPGKRLRVRCGKNFTYCTAGWDYTDSATNLWIHDQSYTAGTWGYSGGSEGYVNAPVTNTADPTLFQGFRTYATTYRVPVANGDYWLNLGFADMRSTGICQRVMDVDVQGQNRVSGLDVFSEVGPKTAMMVPLFVTVTNGMLTFTVRENGASRADAFLNCFEVLPYANENRAPVAQDLSVMARTTSANAITLRANDPDGNLLTYRVASGSWPRNGTLGGVAPNLFYTPTNSATSDSFMFVANDGKVDSDPATVSIMIPSAGVAGSVFNPLSFPTIGATLAVSSGTVAIDTKDGVSAPTLTANSTVYTGRVVTNQNRKVALAMFNFGQIGVSSGVLCTVTGNLGVVLAATGDIAFASVLNVSGVDAVVTNGGSGGPGAEGGVRMSSFNSMPPPANRGNSATGYGAGGYVSAGAGGGFGGCGGDANGDQGKGGHGLGYGDDVISDLYGGSGGGNTSYAVGGGGGGSVELVANGRLTFSGTIAANGGAGGYGWRSGGGGSGGGVILAADAIVFTGTVNAKGGAGGSGSAGGGGGGRVAFYCNNTLDPLLAGVSISGGASGGNGADAGTAGTFHYTGRGGGFAMPFPYIVTDVYGIPDSWKVQYFGSTSATNAGAMCDADGDGLSNYAEWKAGTNPRDADSSVQCSVSGVQEGSQPGTNMVLRWQGVLGKFYTIQKSTNLLGGFTISLQTGIPGTGTMNSRTVQVSEVTGYYRVKVE
ncbi:MAG: hypothetical protein C0404_07795 [Verrucomicrobia bacterium]|nr:hypothetical protein [Verrucomicrobiota bacterium]